MVVVAAVAMGLPSEQRTGSTLRRLMRRKQVDDSSRKRGEGQQLAKRLSVLQLIPIGVGSTIGAGVYVLIGTVARERSGPSLTLSFLIAGIAAALSAFCYAELSSRCPSAGSAYHYAYICVGEGIAWLIGWALVLEYTVGGSAVARGIAPNLALLIGGEDKFPAWLVRRYIAGTNIEVDPCAGLLVVIVTLLLCSGIKESAMVQAAITSANVCVLIFVIVAGAVIGFKTDWPGYSQSHGYLPFGVNGMLGGAATVFFAYIGFDTVASTAEEVKHPQRDLPLGIGLSLLICGSLYMLVSSIIVGIVPYYEMDVNTPISAAFTQHGMQWAMYIVTAGAVAALSSTLMGSLIPQPRIMMAMARDGLLPAFFVKVSKMTAIPINGTLVNGLVATLMAFTMDLDQLSGMVSFGTLLAFAAVGASILILRYVPPADAHVLTAQDSSPAVHSHEFPVQLHVREEADGHPENPLLTKEANYEEKKSEERRRRAAAMSILAICIGGVLIAVAATAELLPRWARWTMGSMGLLAFASGSIVLVLLDQDQGRHTFGHSGGFICPFVPWLPIASILINAYLLADLGISTWLRVGVWLVIGVAIYIFYGMRHSLLSEETGLEIHEDVERPVF